MDVVADARLNPDVDKLNRLELVVLGDVDTQEPAGGSDRIHLQKTLTADHSVWIAIRAYDNHQQPQFTTVAHSAPIYVIVDDEPSWKAQTLVELVRYQRAQLTELLTVRVDAPSPFSLER